MRNYLKTHLEQNVGCILTEQLQQFEINQPQMEKASLEYNRLENLFQSFHNQQFITLAIDTKNETTINPPVIVCLDILMNELNSTENFQERMDLSDQEKNELPNNSTYEKMDSTDQEKNELPNNSTCETKSRKYFILRNSNLFF